jgi:hypothetical protein
VSEVGERIKGGAVKEDKSPENDAILISVRGDERERGRAERSRKGLSARFQEGGPGSTLSCWNGLNAQGEEVGRRWRGRYEPKGCVNP